VRLAAGPTGCATVSETVSFRRTIVETTEETPRPSTPPTDMLPATDVDTGGDDQQPLWPWVAFTLLGAGVIVAGGVVVRRSRKPSA